MRIPEIAVKKPISTAMVFLAIFVVGIISFRFLPLDVMPELEIPSLTVITVYPGASAEEVEEQVSKVLEATLATTSHLKEITSTSKENVSFVQMQFSWGTNATEAASNARDILDGVSAHLPDGARKPIIYKINSSMMPVLIYGVSANENYYGLDKILEEKIAAPLRKADGVGTVIYLGQPRREIMVMTDPMKLKAYNLSVNQLATILKAENISIPGGSIKVGARDFSIHVPGEFSSVEEICNIPLVNFNNQIIRLNDVATVEDSFAEDDEIARNMRGEGAALMIQKQSGENTLEVVRSVRAKMEEVRKNLPPDVKIDEVIATDEIVTETLSSLASSLFWAMVFVIIVVFMFLREWKGSFIVFLTIPFSLIAAIIAMYAMGWTINIFSMLSLIIAIGMVVDNAIVVLENITRHIEQGARPKEAAIFGTSEMGRAIAASTLTTIMVFLPMIFMGGIVGILFKQLAILTAITMVASLFTALALTPMVSSQLLKGRKKGVEHRHSMMYRAGEASLRAIEKVYKRILKWTVNHKLVTLILAVVILGLTAWFAKNTGTDYIPNFDASDLVVVMETPVGTAAAETDKVAQKVMDIIVEEVPERVEGTLVEIAGQTNDGALTAVGFKEGKNVATIICHLVKPDERERSAKEIGDVVRKRVEEIPGISKFHVTSGNILMGALLGNEKPVEVKVLGQSYKAMNPVALEIQNFMSQQSCFVDIENTIDPGKLELKVNINRQKASDLGLNSAMIGMQVRQSIYGTDAGDFKENGEQYSIVIRYDKQYRQSVEDIRNIMLTTLHGSQVRLAEVAHIEQGYGPLEIKRTNQERVVRVAGNLEGLSLGEAKEMMEEYLDTMELPEGVEVELAGQINQQDDSFADLTLVLILGVLLVYMVMAGQFESLKHPFIIMLAVPFMAVGIFLAFKITGLTLSVTTFIGVIMLTGIVVNNGIVLVDYTNLLRSRGKSVKEAVTEAGRSRLRPVLMTTATTILAMVPMALSQGMGKEMFSPLGVTIIGGLFISTLVTLIFVPTVYAAFHHRTIKRETLMVGKENE
ncbi:MAG: acriflavine resistance protein B [Bacteroidetes bacterium]|nr:MAG: acriflavine resistance protein B [Bacteroidota bacterium]PIE88775.1 MAG: acriflavine resistance protein B [Bacteroidota bacterium]